MKFFIKYIFLFLCFASYAQIADFSIAVNVNDEICDGNGTVVTTISGELPNSSIVYTLYKLPNVNSFLIQSLSPVFSGLSSGNYKIVVTQSLNGESASKELIFEIKYLFRELDYHIVPTIINDCSVYGNLTINVIQGDPSLFEIVSGPIMFPPQASNFFEGLVPGMYNIRVFDQCNNAIVTTFQLDFDYNVIEIVPEFEVENSIDCTQTKLTNFLFSSTSSLHYPIQANIVIYPPDGSNSISQNLFIESGDLQLLSYEALINTQGWDEFNFTLQFIDSCGFGYHLPLTNVDLLPEVNASSSELECNKYSMTIITKAISLPYEIEFTNIPDGVNLSDLNEIFPGPYDSNVVVFGNEDFPAPSGRYDFVVIDACGRSFVDFVYIEPKELEPNIRSINNGCGAIVGTIRIIIPEDRKITFIELISAPDNYNEALPHDLSFLINDNGIFNMLNVPVGTYIFHFIDNCGSEYTKTVIVPEFIMSQLASEVLPDCESNFGSVKLSSGNGKLVSVLIIEAPESFNQPLPFNVSNFINIGGVLMMNGLPEGLYVFRAIDICGFHLDDLSVMIHGYVESSVVSIFPQCNSFSVKVNDPLNDSADVSFWLQKKDGQGNWMHPVTSNIQQNQVVDTSNAIYVIVNEMNSNLNFIGEFRIVKKIKSFSSEQGSVYCYYIIKEFYYDGLLQINGAYTLDCIGGSGAQSIFIDGIGIPPYSYSIILKDNLPFVVNNGSNNIFEIATPGLYTFKIEDSCGSITTRTFDLSGILPLANAFQATNMLECAIDTSSYQFNLESKNNEILGNQNLNNYSVKYFLSYNDASLSQNQLPSLFQNTSNPQTIFARVDHNVFDICYDISSFELIVGTTPDVEDVINRIICENSSIRLEAPPDMKKYLWSTGETSRSIIVRDPGSYSVEISNQFLDLYCSNTQFYELKLSNPAKIEHVKVSDWNDLNNSFEVFVSGHGDYEFSIDNIHFQDSNVFSNLPSGEYTFYVRDKNLCGTVSGEVYLLTYPKFFTPNGDGYNDYWHIKFANHEPNMKILIFDRYGKLVKDLNPYDVGWDGTLHNKLLPSTDYWFKVTRENKIIHHGHFSLKR